MMNTIFSIWPEDERDRKRAACTFVNPFLLAAATAAASPLSPLCQSGLCFEAFQRCYSLAQFMQTLASPLRQRRTPQQHVER